MTQITQLYRYPVKSFAGERLEQTELAERGIPGDRAWCLRDATGTVGAKKFPQLMSAQARLLEPATTDRVSPPVEITLPDGQMLLTTDTDAGTLLSAFTEQPIAIWPLVDATNLAHYRRAQAVNTQPTEESEAQLRAVFARLDDEPLPDFSLFPPDVFEFETAPGTYFDAFPLLIMSNAALELLSKSAPEQDFDVRRFRPNIMVETKASGFIENEWIGKDCQIGEAIVHIEMACPRCIMTTHPVAHLPKDPRIMRSLVKHNDGNLGVYASIVRPGRIRCGDTLEPITAASY